MLVFWPLLKSTRPSSGLGACGVCLSWKFFTRREGNVMGGQVVTYVVLCVAWAAWDLELRGWTQPLRCPQLPSLDALQREVGRDDPTTRVCGTFLLCISGLQWVLRRSAQRGKHVHGSQLAPGPCLCVGLDTWGRDPRVWFSLVSPVGWALRTGRLLACCAWVTVGSLDCQEEPACDPRGQLTAGVPDFEPSQKDSWVYFLMQSF